MENSVSSRKKESYKIFDDIAKTYDFLNHLLSFGIDIYWRKKLLKNLPTQKNQIVLDLATGTGDLALVLETSPKVQKVIGMDLSKGMIEVGKKKVQERGLTKKIEMRIGDGCNIDMPDQSVDVVTISFGIRNFPDPLRSLKEIKRVLKPNGRVLIMEFGMPKNFIVNAVYTFYFRHLLPFVGNIISGHKDAYKYLNQSVEQFAYGNDFVKWMEEAELKNSHFKELTFGITCLYIADK